MANSKHTLVKLPVELLVIIAQDDVLSEEDLSAFSRTCRSIRLAVTQICYAAIIKRNRIPILHWAAERGFLDMARQLLDIGADPNQYWCSTKPRFVLNQDRNSKPQIPSQDEYWDMISNQQHDAIMDRTNAIAPRLSRLEQSAWVSANDDWIDFRLQWAWMAQRTGLTNFKYGWLRSGYLEGTNPIPNEHRSPMCFKWTPLHLAVYHGYPELVKVLLNRGSDPGLASSGLCTCAKLSIRSVHEDCTTANISKWTAVHLAACRSELPRCITSEILSVLLGNSDAESGSPWMEYVRYPTAAIETLALAAISGDMHVFEPLLRWVVARGLPIGDSTSMQYWSGPTECELDSNDKFLLRYGIIHCAVKSHHWGIVERLAAVCSPDHSISKSLEVLLQHSATNDMAACSQLLEHGVSLREKGLFLQSICPAPTSSIHPSGQIPDDEKLRVITYVLDRCDAKDINTFGPYDSFNTLGRYMAWHFSLPVPNESGEDLIKTMLDLGGDLHLKDPRRAPPNCRKEYDLTSLGFALKSVVKNPSVGALTRFQHFLHHYAPQDSSTVPEGEYLHKFFVFFAYGSPNAMPKHTLINIARVLLLWGTHPEECDAEGETALYAFLNHMRLFMPAWIASKHRSNWLDEIVYLLACLQKSGARLDSANAEGRTPMHELRILQDSEVPWQIFQSNNLANLDKETLHELCIKSCSHVYRDHEEEDKEERRQILARELKHAVRIVRSKDGTYRMKFRRPKTVFEDLPGDNFVQELLQDEELWLS